MGKHAMASFDASVLRLIDFPLCRPAFVDRASTAHKVDVGQGELVGTRMTRRMTREFCVKSFVFGNDRPYNNIGASVPVCN